MTQLLNAGEIQKLIAKLADQIAAHRPKGAAIALVGIRRRGIPLAERLADALSKRGGDRPPVGSLDISFYRDDLTHLTEQPVAGVTELPFEVDNCVIYLVDDVLYTGRTVRAALDAILAYGRPSQIRLAALIDRGHHELPIRADFVGKVLETAPNDNVGVRVKEVDGVDEVVMSKREP